MVGVVGSSPIAPTKQKSALLGGLEGLTERWALFCCLRFAKLLQNFCKTPTSERQFGAHLNIVDRLVAVSLLIVLRHLLVRVAQQRLNVFLREILLLI